MSSPSPFRAAMVIGGAGALGTVVCRHLHESGVDRLYSLDLRPPSGSSGAQSLVGDVCAPDDVVRHTLASCDLVILALPSRVAEASLAHVVPGLRTGALLVDTLSVKSRFRAAVAALGLDVAHMGINPMFAPDLGFAGRTVLAVGAGAGAPPAATAFVSLLEGWGSVVVALNADEHDRVLASLQVLTHAAVLAFGLALSDVDYKVDELAPLAPPPHRALIALLARVCGNDPEVYRDIQDENPYASQARQLLHDNLARLGASISSPEAFADLIDRLRKMLGTRAESLNEGCVRMFAALERDA